MIKLGIVGYGYWGKIVARNFATLNNVSICMVSDIDNKQVEEARRHYPHARVTLEPHALIADPNIDAVVVTTPTYAHFPLAYGALQAGKHVWIEKPMTETSDQAHILIQESTRQQRVLMVDHTYLYSQEIRALRHLLSTGELGSILYVESQRANLGLIRIGEHVIADLASHDFAILDYLMPEKPTSISASGAAHFRRVQEDIAFITLHYPAGAIAHISVNWLSPIKLRQIRIGGDRKLVTYDDLAIDGKIRVYNSGADVAYDQTDTLPPRITYRQGEAHIIATDSIETLPTACSHFIECIVRKKSPDSDGASGKRIVELVTAATDSMRNHGQRVTLPTSGLPE